MKKKEREKEASSLASVYFETPYVHLDLYIVTRRDLAGCSMKTRQLTAHWILFSP